MVETVQAVLSPTSLPHLPAVEHVPAVTDVRAQLMGKRSRAVWMRPQEG